MALWLFFIGLSIGSFLNVVIYRVPRDQSIVKPRSRCPKCGHQLTWYENIPVFSWLALRGKCSQCKTPISPRYMVVELLTGILFLAALARFDWTWPLVAALTFITLLVPLVFIDAELWILPFELTLPGIALGVLLQLPLGAQAVKNAVIGAVCSFLLYRALEWFGWLGFRKEALGAGDKYLMAMVGGFLGWRPLLGVLFLSSVQGAVFGVLNIVLRGRAGPTYQTVDPATGAANTVATPEAEADEPEPTFTPECFKPGLSLWRRLALVPYTVLFQPIPDDPPPDEKTGEIAEWVPETTALPFGPWIGLAALEVMLIGPVLVRLFEDTKIADTAFLMFGS